MIRIELDKDEKKAIFIIFGIIGMIALIYGGSETLGHFNCDKVNGMYMIDGTCYHPKSEEERQEIIEKGYLNLTNDNSFGIITNYGGEKHDK